MIFDSLIIRIYIRRKREHYQSKSGSDNAVKVRVESEWYGGMMNIGVRPTFDDPARTIEVNIFDFVEEIYGDTIQV
ncbi:MAG: hypothetical protein CL666_08000 [Balneola sp.]|nr:hypothetical protein [Balneola sp.]|tara:strand:- start:1123 stop:1350 length:228 start_codon:yes stop_codon:yes gene_type:complete